MRKHLIVLVVLAMGLIGAGQAFPETIGLPEGIEGEGVAVAHGTTFYAGSLANGFIVRGDVRAGTAEIWVDDPAVVPAVGLSVDERHRLLFVAGGPSGEGAAYDTKTGEAVATFEFAPGFINDVIATRDAAYFTNSSASELYRVPVGPGGSVGSVQTIGLSGPVADDFVPGAFNLNGIEATAGGDTLIVVNSATGRLYTVDPDTGESAVIDLQGDDVATGDGILLRGHTLYVMQNGAVPAVPNQVAVVELSSDLSSGVIVDTITDDDFNTATTLAAVGSHLVTVNAQFVNPDDTFEIVVFGAR